MNKDYETPLLKTMTPSIHLLELPILSQQDKIENWLAKQWRLSPAPVYGSVDLRNSGFKLAPVDMNLFPAGFNNLNPEFLTLSIDAAQKVIKDFFPHAKKILLIPEDHTRNIFYWENIKTLITILTLGKFEVRLGSLTQEVRDIVLNSGEIIKLERLKRHDHIISVPDFTPDIILLNNDLSVGIPEILADIQQPMIPPAELGWHQRLKSEHFQYYADISQEFCQLLNMDAWHIAPLFRHCGEIDFMKREGVDCLTTHVTELLKAIQKKYDEYHITCKPFVVVKADAGTYGMAVMTVRHPDEVGVLNRKQRVNMAKTKSGQPVHRVIVQEGVYTFETWGKDNAVSEPVVYLWGKYVVGGFYRVHQSKGIDENLNAPGMQFEPLPFIKPCHQPANNKSPEECQNRFYIYGVIARLSMLAAAREMQKV